MIKKAIASFILLAAVIIVHAQDKSLYQKKQLILDGDTLPYRILYPKNFQANKKYPLVLFLHGSGERGKDNEKQLFWGADLFLDSSNRENFPAIVVFPQCPDISFWNAVTFTKFDDSLRFNFPANKIPIKPMQMLLALTDEFSKNINVDTNRIYVGGMSMGGFATYDILWRKPHFFAAAFPICGGGNPDQVNLYANKFPMWIFHGGSDPVVPVSDSRLMFRVLKQAGADVKYTEYPGVGHDSWKKAFAEPDLLPWLFAHKKS
jgi:predicted peptidase